MEIKITAKNEDKLFDRIEIFFEINHAASPTPKRGEVKAELAKQLNVNEELIAVRSINTRFGLNISKGSAMLYNDKTVLLKNEPGYILLRNKLIEDKKKETPKEEKRE